MDNTDITQPPSVNSTDTPQPTATNVGASDATPFQQSANAEALKQNKAIQVTPNGKRISGAASHSGMSSSAIIFIIISSVVLVMIASSVFRWIMKRPEPLKANNPEAPKKTPDIKTEKTDIPAQMPRNTAKKKKLPRSKRHK